MKTLLYSTLVLTLFLTACIKKKPQAKVETVPAYASMEFIDQEKKPFSLSDRKGEYTLVSFVFTRCPMPDQCPLTMKLNKQLHREWNKEKREQKLRFVVATIDPEFDTPEVLAGFAKRHNLDTKDFTLITGDEQKLADFASQMANVVSFPSGDLVAHNTKSVLMGPDLDFVAEYKDNEWSAKEVVKTITERKPLSE